MKTKTTAVAKRCAIYARCAVSTRGGTTASIEEEPNSLGAQRETCERYIQNQPGWSLTSTYDDAGLSGGNTNRPGFQRLLAAVKATKVDMVVVSALDRLSRNPLDFAKVMDAFDAHGVAVCVARADAVAGNINERANRSAR